MPFSHNSRNFQLQGGVLHALCERSSTSGYLASKIDLNRFIGNYGGDFQFGHGDFLSTSAHVHLDGTILSGDLPDWKGVFGKSYIDLDQCIDNIDGVLTMANPSSPEEPRSSLVNRSQAWKDKIPSVNFQLFNCGDDNAIPDSYMVKLKRDSNMTKHIERLQKQMPPSFVDSKPSFELKFQSKLLNEYAANFTGEGLLRVATSSDVEIISSETKGWGAVVTSNASWGLQAISQRVPLPANSDPFSQTYEFDTVIDPGSPGVDVYIIDSGINADEASLVDRAVHRVAVHNGVIFDGPEDDIYDEPQIHGTAIASIIAEIAPTARIISIKTLRPQGGGVWAAEGDDLQALEWVYHFTQTFRRPSIVNFCITHPRPIPTETTPISRAVQFLVDAGIPVCAAAGNSSEDAGNYAPGHLDDVITVAASDIQNQLCQFSNWGGSVSIVAPGEAIWAAGDYRSGTSFATPHVTGVASNILAANPQLGAQPPMTAQALRIELLSRGTPDVLNPIPLPNNTVNLLLHQ